MIRMSDGKTLYYLFTFYQNLLESKQLNDFTEPFSSGFKGLREAFEPIPLNNLTVNRQHLCTRFKFV